ncbi:SARP family transcriptional regulator [Pseudorhizobium halotolerans]|uniref:SARP family transcriptional regulator n=1 Tax=Pseudorhizobium halotolerans TaxID=1233081 RepID=A0ABN7K216_9HYPH|nr:SARP family transcriptional regulator [Pseudorhizobium halotolerans]CAD7052154.1 SARP family transcriptional regulator [Pseudorhizobium halotolerans]
MHRAEGIRAEYRLYLLGSFALTDLAGTSLAPKSQKAQALLAMLALSRRGSRSRVWLRDKLWSDRSEEQGSASLRQALLEIRKSLGSARKLVQADKLAVWLDLDRVELDINEATAPEGANDQLLEGIDVGDPEFEEWLTLERQNWQTRLQRDRDGRDARYQKIPSDLALSSDLSPLGQYHRSGADLLLREDREDTRLFDAEPLRPVLMRLQPPQVIGLGDKGRMVALQLQDLLTRSLHETLGIGVADLSFDTFSPSGMAADPSPAKLLPITARMRLTFEGDAVLAQAVIRRRSDGAHIWSGEQLAHRFAVRCGSMSELHPIITQIVDQVGQYLLSPWVEDSACAGADLIHAIDSIFRLSRGDLERAERLLDRSIRQSPSGGAYAWQAFIRTFQVGQRFSIADARITEEARELSRKALELDPTNPVSLALVGHVHSFLFADYDRASQLFEKAIHLNPAQPLGWDLYAMLHCFTGQPIKAVAISRWVSQLVPHSRYKYYFDTTRCVSAALAGDYAAAIAAGEEALMERPQFNSVLRYLAASHAHANHTREAHKYLTRLQAIEPDVSVSALRESRYPLLGTEGGQLLIEGLIKAGIRPQ